MHATRSNLRKFLSVLLALAMMCSMVGMAAATGVDDGSAVGGLASGLTPDGTATVDNDTVKNGTGDAVVTTEGDAVEVLVTLTADGEGLTIGGEPQEGVEGKTQNYHLTIPMMGLTAGGWLLVTEKDGQYSFDSTEHPEWNVADGNLMLWLPVEPGTCKVVLKKAGDSKPDSAVYQVVNVTTEHAPHYAGYVHKFADYTKPASTDEYATCATAGCDVKIAIADYYELCPDNTGHADILNGATCDKCGYEGQKVDTPTGVLTPGTTATIKEGTLVNGIGAGVITKDGDVVKVVVTLTATGTDPIGGQPEEGKPDGTQNYHLTIPMTGLTTDGWSLVTGGEQGGQYSYDDPDHPEWNVAEDNLMLWLSVEAGKTCKVVLQKAESNPAVYQVVEVTTEHHTHTWSTGDGAENWASDSTQHWRFCTDGAACPGGDKVAKKDAANHVDEVGSDGKAGADGKCDVCGYDMTPPVHKAEFASHAKTDFGADGKCTKKLAGDAECTYTLTQFQEDCAKDENDGHQWNADGTGVCDRCGVGCQHPEDPGFTYEPVASNEGHHKVTCKTCGKVTAEAEACVDKKNNDTNAAEPDNKCDLCGGAMPVVVTHVHAFGDGTEAADYGSNATQHWLKCKDADCPGGEDKNGDPATQTPENHNWDVATGKCTKCGYECLHDWTDNSGTCKTCGFVHVHDTADLKYVALTGTDVGNHKQVCEVCGKVTIEKEACEFNGDVTCDKCGYVHVHDLGANPEWVTEPGNPQHWHACSDQNCPTGGKTDLTYHVYDPTTGKCVCNAVKPHEHTWSSADAWHHDNDQHWRYCTVADCPDTDVDSGAEAKDAIAYHSFVDDDGDPDTPEVCSVCGFEKPEGYVEPDHVWETEWDNDTTHHWHNCDKAHDAECTAKNDYAVHEYDPETGLCECGAEKPHEHNWSWVNTDPNEHWQTCDGADCNGLENARGAHTFGDWTVTQEATDHEAGSRERECAACGYKQTEVIPANHDNWDTDWSSDDTNHWHKCLEAGCDGIKDSEPHAFGAWTVTKEATATEDGSREHACTICDKTVTEVIPATGTPSHTHDWAKVWSSDGTNHWHACSGCSEVQDKAPHTFGDWTVDRAATSTTAGERSRVCSVCEYKQTEVIPATGGGNYGGGGGGGSSSSNTTTTTTKNPDGSTTTTKTDKKTGTVTETTKRPDGTTEVVTTLKDGSSTAVTTTKQGVVATVKTDATGKTETEVKVPAAAVAAAGDKPVVLPVAEAPATSNLANAPAITISTGRSGATKVAIPSVSKAPGVVAVIVKADGSTEVLKTSVPTQNGVVASVPDGATVKVIDNSKSFVDVPSSNWANSAAAFVSARGLFVGTSATDFSPNLTMNRAMLTTVLARLGGADTSGGATWYEQGMTWAQTHGLTTSTDAMGDVSRQEMITMIWRYYGAPAATGNRLSQFSDAARVSADATEAMRWAIEVGIVNGNDQNALMPESNITRAEVAQLLQNIITILNLPQEG